MIDIKEDISEIINSDKSTNDRLWTLLRLLKRFPKLIEQHTENVLQELESSLRDELETQKGDTKKIIESFITELKKYPSLADIRKPKDGKQGERGKDADEKKIIKDVMGKIRIPRDGKDGRTPIKGEDYFDGEDGKNADETKIISRILKRIPKPKDGNEGSPDTGEQIIDKINKTPIRIDTRIDASRIRNLPQQRLGGGGTTTNHHEDIKTFDGSDNTFVLTREPKLNSLQLFLGVGGGTVKQTQGTGFDYTLSGRTVTFIRSASDLNGLVGVANYTTTS